MLLLEDKIAKVLNKVRIGDEFGAWIENDDYDIVDDIDWQLRYDRDVKVNHGVSKIAFIIDGASEVAKISFNGYYTSVENESFDENIDEWDSAYEDVFTYFEGAEGSECSDYCQSEYELYEAICEDGFGEYFAKVRPYDGEYHFNHKVFLQEKVIVHEDANFAPTQRSRDYIKKEDLWISQCSDWNALFVDYYGEEKAKEFSKYIHSTRCVLGEDLHGNNIGYRMNGAPVVLDYTGWNY